ncbi:MAG: hypothetical protein ABJA80_05125 [bacterium]
MGPATVRALLTELIDYAGLFPPAALPMSDVAHNYAHYRRSADGWALGRLVVPVARLDELSAALPSSGDAAPRVSALVGDDALHDAEAIRRVNDAGRIRVDAVEVRTPDVAAIERAVAALGGALTVYCEIPVAGDPRDVVSALAHAGARAKIRTGGVTSNAFPSPADVARFLVRCAEQDVPFKATAGLHHPLRGSYRLTYADGAPSGVMFGFLNVFVAAVFARKGLDVNRIAVLLDEQDPLALALADASVAWRGERVLYDDVLSARTSFAIAFGSCSFREPIDDLHHLGLL